MSSRSSWGQMLSRCYDPQHPKYKSYGGRGIRVCDRWICFRLFLEDVGERPEGKTLNRINNDGNYEPSNCEWADYLTQAQNTRCNKNLTYNGETKCMSEWSRSTGIKRKTIARRLEYGWTVEQALTTAVAPSQKIKDRKYEERYLR